jgi:hypothetical protein
MTPQKRSRDVESRRKEANNPHSLTSDNVERYMNTSQIELFLFKGVYE